MDEQPQRDEQTGRFLPGNSGGPGRPPLKSLIDRIMSDADWEDLLKHALRLAKRKDGMKALEFLVERYYGKVPQDSNVNMSGSISVESVVQVLEDLRNKEQE